MLSNEDLDPKEGRTMFKALHAVAQHAGFTLEFTAIGSDQMSVKVTPAAADPSSAQQSFTAAGTPEDIEERFTEALDEYRARMAALRGSFFAALEPRPATRAKTKRTTPKRAAPKRKRAKPLKRTKPAARSKPAAKVKARAPSKPARTNSDGKADKAACVADYIALLEKHGSKLTRRLFVKEAQSGRRYERLWPDLWAGLVRAAGDAKNPGATPAAASSAAAKKPAANAARQPAGTPARTTIDPAAKWPFATGTRVDGVSAAPEQKTAAAKPAAKPAAKKAAATAPQPSGPTAYGFFDAKDKQIAVTLRTRLVGGIVDLASGRYIIERIDDAKKRYYIKPLKGAPPEPEPKKPAAEPAAPSPPAAPPAAEAPAPKPAEDPPADTSAAAPDVKTTTTADAPGVTTTATEESAHAGT